HDELVVRAAAGVRRGHGAEGAAFHDDALATPHCVLVELGRRGIPMDGPPRREARGLERGGPGAFRRPGGVRGHAGGRGRPPCSWASTAAITAMLTMSFTSEPRCSTWTGCAIPTRIGPMAWAPPTRSSSL